MWTRLLTIVVLGLPLHTLPIQASTYPDASQPNEDESRSADPARSIDLINPPLAPGPFQVRLVRECVSGPLQVRRRLVPGSITDPVQAHAGHQLLRTRSLQAKPVRNRFRPAVMAVLTR